MPGWVEHWAAGGDIHSRAHLVPGSVLRQRRGRGSGVGPVGRSGVHGTARGGLCAGAGFCQIPLAAGGRTAAAAGKQASEKAGAAAPPLRVAVSSGGGGGGVGLVGRGRGRGRGRRLREGGGGEGRLRGAARAAQRPPHAALRRPPPRLVQPGGRGC